jgi:uncharacterized membrane protein YedE/YeeE
LIGDFTDDLDADIGGRRDAFRVVAAVGPDQADEREEGARDLRRRSTAVAVLDIAGMGFDKQGASIAIDQSMTLAPRDLLACIVAARPPLSVVFTLWLSMIAALGLTSRAARWRSAMTRAWFIRSKARQRLHQRAWGLRYGTVIAAIDRRDRNLHGSGFRHRLPASPRDRIMTIRDILPGLVVGTLFGSGLALSDMINPARVLAFLDIAGAWDPTLAFVMGGALLPSALGYLIARRMRQPVLAQAFCIPENRTLDGRLLTGAAIFGAGWGLVGFCPGPALAALAFGMWQPVVFVAAMLAGMMLHRLAADRLTAKPAERAPFRGEIS